MSETFVSVVLAVRNEERFIARTLDALLRQDYPADALEIIVADGASDDGTIDVIRALDGAGRIRIIPNPRRIQSAGLNLTIQQSHGDVIIRVDGHTVVAPNYVRQCVILLQQTGAWNVGGHMDPAGLTPMGKAIAAAGATPFAVPSAFRRVSTAQFTDTVYMGAWPRAILLALGGFDERLRANEDYELNYRIRRAGGRIYLSPALHSTYICRQSLPALARQYLRYGVGKADMLLKFPASVRLRQLVAPAFVAILLCSLVFWQISPAAHALLLSALLSYGMVCAVFSAHTAWRQRADAGVRLVWRLPLVYLTIHLCWGMGLWLGLLRGGADRLHESTRESTRLGGWGDGADARLVAEAAGRDLRVEERHGR